MSDIVRTPESATDPYSPEPSNVAPVLLRLRHLDGTTTDIRESKDVLEMPLFLLGGRVYVRRGADGVRHLYREVPELPRLDAAATRGEEVAHVSGRLRLLAKVEAAAERCRASRTTSWDSAFRELVTEERAALVALGVDAESNGWKP